MQAARAGFTARCVHDQQSPAVCDICTSVVLNPLCRLAARGTCSHAAVHVSCAWLFCSSAPGLLPAWCFLASGMYLYSPAALKSAVIVDQPQPSWRQAAARSHTQCHAVSWPSSAPYNPARTLSLPQVVSNRMQKTVVVAVDRYVYIPKYRTTQRRTSRIMVSPLAHLPLAFVGSFKCTPCAPHLEAPAFTLHCYSGGLAKRITRVLLAIGIMERPSNDHKHCIYFCVFIRNTCANAGARRDTGVHHRRCGPHPAQPVRRWVNMF